MKIILFQPEIPANTGNIVRTCSATGASLILVGPLGFSTSDRMLKRAGLDYWGGVDVTQIDCEEFDHLLATTTSRPLFFSSKVSRPYTDIAYRPDDLLIFGSETKGLPARYLKEWSENVLTIPMLEQARCLNLSNSAAIVIYEAVRQIGLPQPLLST